MPDISNTCAELVPHSCSCRFAVRPGFTSFVLDALVGNAHGSAPCEDATEPADKNADGGHVLNGGKGTDGGCEFEWRQRHHALVATAEARGEASRMFLVLRKFRCKAKYHVQCVPGCALCILYNVHLC